MYAKVYLYLMGLLLAALVVCGVGWYTTSRINAIKDNAVQDAALEANTRAAEVHAKETVKVYRGKEKAIEQVREVSERHPEWADEPVPDDVADILRDPADPTGRSD